MIPLRWLIVGALALVVFAVGYAFANQFPPPTIRVSPPMTEEGETRTPTPQERQAQVVTLTNEAEGETVILLPSPTPTLPPSPTPSPRATVTRRATSSATKQPSPTTSAPPPSATVDVPLPVPPSGTPQILRFELDTESVAWDGTVTATWETTGYDAIFITIGTFEYQPGTPLEHSDTFAEGLPASGSQTFNVADILKGNCAVSSLEWHFNANHTMSGTYDRAEAHLEVDLSGFPVSVDGFTMSPDPVASNGITTISYEGRGGQQLMVVGDYFLTGGQNNGWTNAGKYWGMITLQGDRGSYNFQLPNRHTPSTSFSVLYGQPDGFTACTTYTLNETCPYAYWIDEPTERTPESCPTSNKATVNGSYQRFEHGVMLWDGDLKLIHVLYDDGTNAYYHDTWSGQPLTYPAEPPPGTIAPTQGFGYVWTTYPDLQSRLGWAVEAEQPYTMTRQWVKNGYGGFYDGYGVFGPMYLTRPNGDIVRARLGVLSGGEGWEVIS